MRVVVTPSFRKDVKRLHANQKRDLDAAVQVVLDDPATGERKFGDLAWLRVYKFRMVNQITLLAYEIKDEATIILHAVGSHENFYRDLKN
jgi:mRNA interferase RelE/StbE